MQYKLNAEHERNRMRYKKDGARLDENEVTCTHI